MPLESQIVLVSVAKQDLIEPVSLELFSGSALLPAFAWSGAFPHFAGAAWHKLVW